MEKFQRELFGYNRKEVNDFVNLVVAKTEELTNIVSTQAKTIQELQEQIRKYQNHERDWQSFFQDKREEENASVKEIRQEASRIMKEARNNADRIIMNALVQNERIEEQRKRTERNLKKFKNKLRVIVEQQLDIIEEIEEVEMDD